MLPSTHEYTKADLNELLQSNDKDIVIDALLYSCFNINDAEWIQDTCLQLISKSEDKNVRQLAITCIGHVARMYGKINQPKVLPILNKLRMDENLSGCVSNTFGDIEVFILRKERKARKLNKKLKIRRKISKHSL
jgi:hypothetical protein